MENKRRLFLSQISVLAGITALSKPLATAASVARSINTLHASNHQVTVYHTNDLNGHVKSSFDQMGGLGQVNALLQKQPSGGLLLDAGNFLNAANNVSAQKNTIRLMNSMGYHAAAVGGNELANGQDHLAALAAQMQFSLVNCNYNFNKALGKMVKPYLIVNSGKFKIGITAVGRQLSGIGYNNPVVCANKTALHLKENKHCDMVICLSHLGYSQQDGAPDAKQLAAQSANIDMIISSHNPRLLSGPVVARNKVNHEVIISHAAWNGLMIGKTTFGFNTGKQKININAQHLIAGQPYGETYVASFAKLRTMEKQLISA